MIMPVKHLLYVLRNFLNLLFPKRKLFLTCLREYFTEVHLDKDHTKETVKKYKFAGNNIEKFMIANNIQFMNCNQISATTFSGLRQWLHSNLESCGKTHSSRHLEKCIAAMDYAVKNGWAKYNPLNSLETGRDKRKKVVYLDKKELDKWIKNNWVNEVYRRVQVLSIFQAATGLSYGNLFDYKTRYDDQNGLWIEDNRKKVGQKPFYVPLSAPEFKIAKSIHDYFKGQLPVIDRGRYNKYIKEMADQLGFAKAQSLTSHSFRKTFATLMDQEGFELGVIAAILGNTEEICRDHYISPTKKKVEKAFKDREETAVIRNLFAN